MVLAGQIGQNGVCLTLAMKIEGDHKKLVMDWVRKSIHVHQGKGSAAFYDLLSGWSGPYPETTGYLLPTLWNVGMEKEAHSCAQWLLSLQQEDGSFPGGVGKEKHRPPLVFDTGMILLGLIKMLRYTNDQKYREAIEKCSVWLLAQMGEDGVFSAHTYVKFYSPSYHTRVLWALLEMKQMLTDKAFQTLKQSFSAYQAKIQAKHAVLHWGFRPNEAALTHTIAYTYRGLLESEQLLDEEGHVLRVVEKVLKKLYQLKIEKGKLASSFDLEWNGSYGFRCLVGEVQLACLAFRVYQINHQIFFRVIAEQFLAAVTKAIWKWPSFAKGGISGAQPIWGAYQRFRWINWGAKFYLDACVLREECLSKDNQLA